MSTRCCHCEHDWGPGYREDLDINPRWYIKHNYPGCMNNYMYFIWALDNQVRPICGSCVKMGVVFLYVV